MGKLCCLLLAICCLFLLSATVTADRDDEDIYSWEGKTFDVTAQELQKLIKRKLLTLRQYHSRRPVTQNNILEYLESTRKQPANLTYCKPYEHAERLVKSIRKQHNPIECYTGRSFNRTRNIESRNELVNVLAPYPNVKSNTTRKMVSGNCVFVMFYTESCLSSRLIFTEYHNTYPFFPNIQFALVDSLKFYTLNADFGITGLPTLMLFHQGKPVRKFNLVLPTAMNLIKFLWKNTNLQPAEEISIYHEDNFYFPPIKEESDPYLTLAWSFIFISFLYYTAHTAAFQKCVAFTKRMWLESGVAGGHHLHND